MLEGISGINYRKLELKMSNIKISINQINTKVGSLYSNTEKIIEKITMLSRMNVILFASQN
ncbi:MAG: hypothetical protein Ct9H90mP2_05320 [Dehalococcoidia bacterium]|nr:MAG: hypothetical protein Ct9H90mP2_05320 [Dehalococcoidia bacterium]